MGYKIYRGIQRTAALEAAVLFVYTYIMKIYKKMKDGTQDHDASKLKLKEALVDLDIQPVIKWLNSHEGIYTRFCCQGDYKKDGNAAPYQGAYVLFFCDDPVDLIKVCDRLGGLAKIEVEVYQGMLRYKIYFERKASLDTFLGTLE